MEDSGNDYAIYPLTCSPRRAKKRKKEVAFLYFNLESQKDLN